MPKRAVRVEVHEMTIVIGRFEQTYYISDCRRSGGRMEDEAIIEVAGRIQAIDAAYKRHLGRDIEMTFIRSRSFSAEDDTPTTDHPFLLTVVLKKDHCSLMGYLPADAFWALPSMISSGSITHVEARFDKPHYGSASLISLHFTPASKLTATK